MHAVNPSQASHQILRRPAVAVAFLGALVLALPHPAEGQGLYYQTPVVQYTFETDSGGAVTNNQPVIRVDDVSGNAHHLTWTNQTTAQAVYQSTETSPAGPAQGGNFRMRFGSPDRGYFGHLFAAPSPDFDPALGGDLESFEVSFDFSAANVYYGEEQRMACVVNAVENKGVWVPDYTGWSGGWRINLNKPDDDHLKLSFTTKKAEEWSNETTLSVEWPRDTGWHSFRVLAWSHDATQVYAEVYFDGELKADGVIWRPFYDAYTLSVMGQGKADSSVKMDNFIFAAIEAPPKATVLTIR